MGRSSYHKYLLAKQITQGTPKRTITAFTERDVLNRIILNIDPWEEYCTAEPGHEYQKFIRYCKLLTELYREKKIDETTLIDAIPTNIWPEENVVEIYKIIDICNYLALSRSYEKGRNRFIRIKFPNIDKYYDKLEDLISIIASLYKRQNMKK